MSDPLSIAASIAGLVTLAQSLYQLLVCYIADDVPYSKDFQDLVGEIRSLCGVLCLLEPVIKGARLNETNDGVSAQNQLPVANFLLLVTFPLSIETLSDCKDVLNEFADALKKHAPSNSKMFRNALTELKWALKDKGRRASILTRLERHKNTLELALLGLSLSSIGWNPV